MRQDASRTLRQEYQQLEFPRRQADLHVSADDAVAVSIDHEIAARQLARRGGRPSPRRSAARTRASSSSDPNGLVT